MEKVIKDLKDLPDAPKNKTPSLPTMTGPGVETPKIPALDKFIRKYESAKEKRCAESPGEVAAKKELQYALHQQRASLPINSEGEPFYRSEEFERDYILSEKMKMKKFGAEDDDED
jgi:hypothetical protein